MTLITDGGLGLLNLAVSAANLALVIALVASLVGRLHAERKGQPMSRESGVAGTTSLILLALLATLTALPTALGGVFVECVWVAQVLALALRLGVLIVLLAWAALSIQNRLAPKQAERLDRLIRVRRDHGHQH